MIPRFLPPAVYVLYYLLLLRVSEMVNVTQTPVIRLLYIKKVKGFCRCNQVPNQLTLSSSKGRLSLVGLT